MAFHDQLQNLQQLPPLFSPIYAHYTMGSLKSQSFPWGTVSAEAALRKDCAKVLTDTILVLTARSLTITAVETD